MPPPFQSTFFFFLQKVKVFGLKSIRLPVPIVKHCLKLILVSNKDCHVYMHLYA